MHRRAWVLAALLLQIDGAQAALSCAQLGGIAQTTVRYRDQGYSLSQLLANADELQQGGKLTPREILTVKAVIEESFKDDVNPEEVVETCRQAHAEARKQKQP